MKKITLIVFILFAFGIISIAGCQKAEKQTVLNETMESMEGVPPSITEETPPVSLNEVSAVAPTEKIQVSAQGFVMPTPEQIQTALKNAGFYTGTIDGKIGPKSKKAIKDFQSANGLVADGKVGKKTWAKLQAFLVAPTNQ
ncbi:MAG: peptidoglycan-binding domain-containing protein [Candidatus Omnitrophota bacterium]